jgi:hypothetical protein
VYFPSLLQEAEKYSILKKGKKGMYISMCEETAWQE